MYFDQFKILKQLDDAEMILHKIRVELERNPNSSKEYETLSNQFHALMKLKKEFRFTINTRRRLNDAYDLCQTMRDMVNIGEETEWKMRVSVQSIYRSIGCHIGRLAPESDEFYSLEQLVRANDHELSVNILNVYEIIRPNECFNFNRSNLNNVRLLFHGSKVNNFLGILSRGLLIPKLVVNEANSELARSDVGMLGYGIYFSDDINTSLKYTEPSRCANTRLVAVCEVALGECLPVYEFDFGLVKAPDGYQSIHGVKNTDEVKSKFNDDEYVIYDMVQYKVKYLLELQLNVDKQAKSPAENKFLLELEDDAQTKPVECDQVTTSLNSGNLL